MRIHTRDRAPHRYDRSASMMAQLEEHRPRALTVGTASGQRRPATYVAWHIRTAEGERSFDPRRYRHILKEPSTVVCPVYLSLSELATRRCTGVLTEGMAALPVFVATTRYCVLSETDGTSWVYYECQRTIGRERK